MGIPFELNIPLATEATLGAVLAPAFGGSFFQPVAIGAIERHDAGYHWFLAGYALEHFLGLTLVRKTRPPASIALLTAQDAELNAYQLQCAEAVKGIRPWDRPRSPFERVDARVGVTVLEPKYLTEEVLIALNRWADRFPHATICVYGAVALSLHKPAESTWSRAFQSAGSAQESEFASPHPFLTFRLYTPTPSMGRRLAIRAQDLVWLRQERALGGLVTPEDADANLQALASFARTLAQGNRSSQRAVELEVEGSLYTREEARFRAAFKDLL
jgi:hypothetical protein